MPKLALTKEMIDKAVELVDDGVYIRHAADYLGIARTTWYDWLEKGSIENVRRCEGYYDDKSLFDESENSIYLKFFLRVKKAEIELMRKLTKRIINIHSVQHHWMPQFKFLIVRFQADFREQSEVNININEQPKTNMTLAEGLELLAEYEKKLFPVEKITTEKITTAEVVEMK